MRIDMEEYARLHAQYEWSINILTRIDEILTRNGQDLDQADIVTIAWLVKQGLIGRKEPD